MNSAIPLYDFQQAALDKLRQTDLGGALFFEPGLGKTRTAIAYAQAEGAKRVLVVCPVNAIGVWGLELRKLGLPAPFVPTGSRLQKAADIWEHFEPGWMVLNYEALTDPAVHKAVQAWRPEVLVADESHKLKTHNAQRTTAVASMPRLKTLLLTGTPSPKNLLDLWSQMRMVDPDVWTRDSKSSRHSFFHWKHRYALWGGYEGREFRGHSGKQEADISRRIDPLASVMTKDEALDLPATTDAEIPLALDAAAYRRYEKAGRDEKMAVTEALRKHQFSGQVKLAHTTRLIEDLTEDNVSHIIVFVRYTAELEALAAEFPAARYIDGSVNAAKRAEIVAEFQNGESGLLIGQIGAASVAIDLTRSSHVIFHSISWDHAEHQQARDRVNRIGQTRPVTYYYPTIIGPGGEDLADSIVLGAVRRKQSIEKVIMDNPKLIGRKDG